LHSDPLVVLYFPALRFIPWGTWMVTAMAFGWFGRRLHGWRIIVAAGVVIPVVILAMFLSTLACGFYPIMEVP
jgi:hypothetical protein